MWSKSMRKDPRNAILFLYESSAASAEDTKWRTPVLFPIQLQLRMLPSNSTKAQMHATIDGGPTYSLQCRPNFALASHEAGGCLQQFGKFIL